jgi:tRNA wybutosine-synthesizing protein 1
MNFLSEKQITELEKKAYGIVGHSSVQICEWNKKAILGKGVCYKEKFYDAHCHKCMQFTPITMWCDNNCIFCWRPMEYMDFASVKDVKWQLPEEYVEKLIEKRIKLLSGFGGNDKADKEKWKDAQQPDHYAISLSGEPTLYPYLPELVKYLKEKKKARTIFIVSNGNNPDMILKLKKEDALPNQLYISVDAPNKELFQEIARSCRPDAWERFQKTLSLLKDLNCRTVLRVTLIKGMSMGDELLKGYAKLIEDSQADFIEVKAYMHIGMSRQRLNMSAMPYHEEIKDYSEKLLKLLPSYKFEDEQIESRIVLLMRKDFKTRFFS